MMLLDRGATAIFSSGPTPLHAAAGAGHLSLIQMFLARGIPVNSLDEYGNTPLHWAAKDGRRGVFPGLLSAGADPLAMNVLEYTPLDVAMPAERLAIISLGVPQCKRLPLHDAIQPESSKLINQLLIRTQNIHQQGTNGNGLLHQAVLRGSREIVLSILARGVDVNATNNKGQTPLHLLAMRHNSATIAEALLDHGANPEARDKIGCQPLHRSCSQRL